MQYDRNNIFKVKKFEIKDILTRKIKYLFVISIIYYNKIKPYILIVSKIIYNHFFIL